MTFVGSSSIGTLSPQSNDPFPTVGTQPVWPKLRMGCFPDIAYTICPVWSVTGTENAGAEIFLKISSRTFTAVSTSGFSMFRNPVIPELSGSRPRDRTAKFKYPGIGRPSAAVPTGP
ncbi:hypothetical protein DIPPA_20872 [Diplonema papillatum]|nr:hypothetical protein DIPPA_20872 [Diplonema papillatum]